MATKPKKKEPKFDTFKDFMKDKNEDITLEETSIEEDAKISFFKTVMGEIYSTKDIDIRSNTNQDQVLLHAIGRTIAEKFYNNKLVLSFIIHIERNAISSGARSRNDMVEIAKGLAPNPQMEDDGARSLSDRLLGRR